MLEFILIAVGLTICFGGIYLKKLVSGLGGLAWGGGLGFLLVMFLAMEVDMDMTAVIIVVAIIAIGMAALAVKFDRFFAGINSFFSSGIIFFVVSLIATEGEFGAAIGIALVIALIASVLSFKFYDYSFIISTALTGGFIASLGGVPLFNDSSLDRVVNAFLWGRTDMINQILVFTVVLGIAGTIVQYLRLKKILLSQTALGGLGTSQTARAIRSGDTINCKCGTVFVYKTTGKCPKCGQIAK